MRKSPLHSLYLLLLLLEIVALPSLQAHNSISQKIATTEADYCLFLNTAATTDSSGFYEEKMGSIVRTGNPGAYHYESLEANAPINYVSESHLRDYCNPLGKDLPHTDLEPQFITYDPFLKSNKVTFQKDPPSFPPSLNTASAGENAISTWNSTLGVFLGLFSLLSSEESTPGERTPLLQSPRTVARTEALPPAIIPNYTHPPLITTEAHARALLQKMHQANSLADAAASAALEESPFENYQKVNTAIFFATRAENAHALISQISPETLRSIFRKESTTTQYLARTREKRLFWKSRLLVWRAVKATLTATQAKTALRNFSAGTIGEHLALKNRSTTTSGEAFVAFTRTEQFLQKAIEEVPASLQEIWKRDLDIFTKEKVFWEIRLQDLEAEQQAHIATIAQEEAIRADRREDEGVMTWAWNKAAQETEGALYAWKKLIRTLETTIEDITPPLPADDWRVVSLTKTRTLLAHNFLTPQYFQGKQFAALTNIAWKKANTPREWEQVLLAARKTRNSFTTAAEDSRQALLKTSPQYQASFQRTLDDLMKQQKIWEEKVEAAKSKILEAHGFRAF